MKKSCRENEYSKQRKFCDQQWLAISVDCFRERERAVSVGCQGVVVSSRHPPTNKQENLYYLTMWLSVIKGVDIIHFLLMKFSFLLPMRRESEVTREESE